MSHMSFGVQDTLPIEEAYGCPQGGAIPLWQLFKAVGQPPHVKGSPERLHPGVQVHL